MTAFIEGYDAVFFDLDGVLYLGPEAVEGAVDGVRRLHEAGVATVYVTNNAARSTAVVAHHLAELGFGAQEQEVVSSAQAASGLLRQELPAGSKVLVAGTDNLVEQVHGDARARPSYLSPRVELNVGDVRDVSDVAAALARGARAFRFRVTRWQGRNKMSQNRPVEVIERIVDHLEADPGEQHNLAEAEPERVAEMEAAMDAFWASLQPLPANKS